MLTRPAHYLVRRRLDAAIATLVIVVSLAAPLACVAALAYLDVVDSALPGVAFAVGVVTARPLFWAALALRDRVKEICWLEPDGRSTRDVA